MALRDACREAVAVVVGGDVRDVLRQTRQRLGRTRAVRADAALGVGVVRLQAETLQRRPQHFERQRYRQLEALDGASIAVDRLFEYADRAGRDIGRQYVRRNRKLAEVEWCELLVDIRLQILEEVRRADIALALAEVQFPRQVIGIRDPGFQFGIAAIASPDIVGAIDVEAGIGAQIVHARTRHLTAGAEAHVLVGRQLERQVQAGEEVRVAGATRGFFAQGDAFEGGDAARVLIGVHHLQAEVALDRNRTELGVDVRLDVGGEHVFVHFPVLGVDVAVVGVAATVVEVLVERQCIPAEDAVETGVTEAGAGEE